MTARRLCSECCHAAVHAPVTAPYVDATGHPSWTCAACGSRTSAHPADGHLLVKSLGHTHSPPVGAPPYPGDCGLDLITCKDAELNEGHSADIPCGVSIALPRDTFGYICARSSTWVRYGLIVIPGVIDQGWRGELFTMVYRPPRDLWGLDPSPQIFDPIKVPAGTRLAQILVLPNLMSAIRLVPVDGDLPPSERGERGFGSSG